jgi:hypothetical protein
MNRTARANSEFEANDPSDRLFVDPLEFERGNVVALSSEQTERLVQETLEHCGYTAKEIALVMHEQAEEFTVNDNVKLARTGNIICARYNKPEAVESFVASLKKPIDRILFVDDNSDNAWNVFAYFAHKQLAGMPTPTVHSFWYCPPLDGRAENSDEAQRDLLLKLAK